MTFRPEAVSTRARLQFLRHRRRERPAHRVYENDRTLAVLDAQPATRGHTLVVPRYENGGVTLSWTTETTAEATGEETATTLREAVDTHLD